MTAPTGVSGLVWSSPRDGDTLEDVPARVTLRFFPPARPVTEFDQGIEPVRHRSE